MNDILTAISTVGFPIVACAGLAWFVYKFTAKLQEASQKREENLLRIIDEQGNALHQIADVLNSISERLERVEDALEQKGE